MLQDDTYRQKDKYVPIPHQNFIWLLKKEAQLENWQDTQLNSFFFPLELA